MLQAMDETHFFTAFLANGMYERAYQVNASDCTITQTIVAPALLVFTATTIVTMIMPTYMIVATMRVLLNISLHCRLGPTRNVVLHKYRTVCMHMNTNGMKTCA